MEMDGLDDVYKYNHFDPSPEEAVAYYLPRLIAGDSMLHGAEKLIHHAEIYTCEPKDLAYHYAPAPQAISSGDRFFFTTCRRKNGSRARSARVAGTGTWTINKTKNVYDHAGAKVGEVKNLSFKKGNACTGWVMEEYRCLLPGAIVADGEKVLCKIHLSPSASAATRQESAAYMMRLQEPPVPPVPAEPADTATVMTASAAAAHVQKRPPAPLAAADLSSSKKTRIAAPVPAPWEEYQDCTDLFLAPAAPNSSSVAGSAAAAETEDEDYMDDRFTCTMDELLGAEDEENKEQDENNNTQQADHNADWESGDLEELEMFLADGDGDDEEEERQAKEAEEFMAAIEKSCNNVAAADLHSPSTHGQRNQFFSFATVN